MGAVVLVVARERTEWWRTNAPTAAEIDAAFRGVDLGTWGRWLGPGPRIVRHVYDVSNAPSGSYGLYTYAVQPFELSDAMQSHATYVLRQLLEALDAQLDASRPRSVWGSSLAWEPSTVAVFDEARNGPASFWTSGQARTTQTRDAQERAFLSFVLSNRENPIGPRTTAPTTTGQGSGPQTLPDRVDELADEAGGTLRRWAPWLILGGLALFGLVFLPEIAGAARARRRAARVVFENPRPRRRRSGAKVVMVDALTAQRLGIDSGYRSELRAITREEARAQGRRIVVKAPSGAVLFDAAPNPAPAVWKVAQPGTAYECKSPLVGQVVPGRGGGLVRACATPTRQRPKQGQVYLVDPKGQTLAGFGSTLPKERAARRIRDAQKPKAAPLELAYLHELHEGYRASGIPAPSGLEWIHVAGSSVCDPQHRRWKGYADALEDARERASIALEGEEVDDFEAYDRATLDLLKRDPRFQDWRRTATQCAQGFDARQARKKPKAQSAATERAAIMREYRELGEGAFVERHGAELSEVLDVLTEGYKKKSAPVRIAAVKRSRKKAAA
jgi:hypothetical protein